MQYIALVPALLGLAWVGKSGVTKGSKPDAVKAPADTKPQAALDFEPNRGQAAPEVRYVARRGRTAVFITDKGAMMSSFHLPGLDEIRDKNMKWHPEKFKVEVESIQMSIVGASKGRIEPDRLQKQTSSYYKGKDASTWALDVPHYGRVWLRSAYPGVDVAYYSQEGKFEYDLVVAPGADPKQIHLAFAGQDSMRLASNGDLVFATPRGDFIQQRPKVYQEIGGKRQEIAASYTLEEKGNVGFELARYDASKPLVIDPVLITSTYYGGTQTDIVTATAGTFVTGYTFSTDIPQIPGQAVYEGGGDAFIQEFQPFYGTPSGLAYVGGSGLDVATTISLSSQGQTRVCIGGFTYSSNFPLANYPYYSGPPYSTHSLGFVTCFSNYSLGPISSTYIGQYDNTFVNSVSVASDDNTKVLVGGYSNRGGLGTSNGGFYYNVTKCFNINIDACSPGSSGLGSSDLDGFAGIYDISGDGIYQNQFKTYEVGGTGDDAINAVSGSTNLMVAVGSTQSTDLPVQNALRSTLGASRQAALIMYVNPSSDTASMISYYGGSSQADTATAVRYIPGYGEMLMGGTTSSPTWPAIGVPLSPVNQGGDDAFVAHFTASNTPSGFTIDYSSTFGGNGDEAVFAVDYIYNLYQTGYYYVGGSTKSSNLPVVNPLAGESTLKGTTDGFILKFQPGVVTFASYLGGTQADSINGITALTDEQVMVAGTTNSGDFPTVVLEPGYTVPQPHLAGGNDGFFALVSTATVSHFQFDAIAAGTGTHLQIPFTATLTNCSSAQSLITSWLATCDLTGATPSIALTVPAHYIDGTGGKYDFVNWNDTTTLLTNTVTISNQYNFSGISASYHASYPLTVSTAGTGSGTATPASGTYYDLNALANITATPNPGSSFTGWTASPTYAVLNASSASTQVAISQATTVVANFVALPTPTLTWATPASIPFGSALSSAQLNATASVPGTFVYNPPAGTVLTAGTHSLSVVFTPTDTTTYATAAGSVNIMITAASPGVIVTRTLARVGADVVVTVMIANGNAAAIANVQITTAKFGAVTGTPMPVNVGSIPAGSVGTASFTLPNITTGSTGTLTIGGTYTGGTFNSSTRATLP
jgi:Divergent InlB B-repeat domain